MRRNDMKSCIVAGLVLATLAACVDSPTDLAAAPAADEIQLATSFDGLAQEQTAAGDVERAEEFRWAALSVRAGVEPARFEVNNDGTREVYSAFVHSVHWITPTLALRPTGHRTFIAWRKEDVGMKVIIIGSHTATAPILNPWSMRPAQPGGVLTSPVLGAHAAFFIRGSNRKAWLGIGGNVKIEEKSAGGTCKTLNEQAPPDGVSCQLARYSVGFDMTLALAIDGTRNLSVQAITKHLVAAEQPVGGVKLSFSCLAPASDRGCN